MFQVKAAVLFTDGRNEQYITLDNESALLVQRLSENGWYPVLRGGKVVSRSIEFEGQQVVLRDAPLAPRFGGGASFTHRVA